jgi:hypothetical protein
MEQWTSDAVPRQRPAEDLPPRKICFLRSDKGDLGLKTPEVYNIPGEWVRSTLGRRAVRLTPG